MIQDEKERTRDRCSAVVVVIDHVVARSLTVVEVKPVTAVVIISLDHRQTHREAEVRVIVV